MNREYGNLENRVPTAHEVKLHCEIDALRAELAAERSRCRCDDLHACPVHHEMEIGDFKTHRKVTVDATGKLAAERAKVSELDKRLAANDVALKSASDQLQKHSSCHVIHQSGFTCREERLRILDGRTPATESWIDTNRNNPDRVLCLQCQNAETLAALKSTDALADIRREVARECAEIADDIARNLHLWNQIRTGGSMAADAIRAKFGVKP